MGKRHHFTYRVKFPAQRWFYYGVHSTTNLNDGYAGSPSTHREKWKWYHWEFEILEFHATREEAEAVERRLIRATWNDELSLNEALGGGLGRRAGLRGGAAAVRSGQLAEARKKCHNEAQRRGASKAISEYNARRDPEWWREQARKGGRATGALIARPVRAVNRATGATHEFSSVAECAHALDLQRSNIYNILNNKRSNPHKGWDVFDPE